MVTFRRRTRHQCGSVIQSTPSVNVCDHRRRDAACCSEWMRASSKHVGDFWNHKRGNSPTIPECCDWKVDCSVDLLSDEFDADSWSRINKHKYTNRTVLFVHVSICIQRKRDKPHWKQGFIDKKFSLAIIPTSLLRALALSSPSIFLSRFSLVSPDFLLCLLSAQVSNTSSEQWPIVFY